jgi:hypothetical protein
MKTAMQELILKLPNEFIFDNPIIILDALEKEKEQIIDANRQGRCNDCPFMYSNEDAEQYYNQTYNQNK